MAVRAKLLPSLLVPLILVLAVLGPGPVVVCSEQPLVDHADLSPPAPPAEPAPSLKPPLDPAGSSAAAAAPVAPARRLFFWGDRPASPVATPEDTVDLQARLRRFPDYPVVENDRVHYFLDRFTGDQRRVIGRWLGRSGRYREMVRRTFRDRGLPEDLAFTAMIESGFDPGAVSRVGAKGLWQFMARTARLYGLRVDRWVDERLDPEKSTVAAAAYLADLYKQFGSWELAQAAYNAGEVKIDKAIRATGSADFWDLRQSKYLRRETKDFVPAIQAAMVIGRDPGQYGFEPGQAVMPD